VSALLAHRPEDQAGEGSEAAAAYHEEFGVLGEPINVGAALPHAVTREIGTGKLTPTTTRRIGLSS
jgi:hypothetical protein